jgi:hypothetical protein
MGGIAVQLATLGTLLFVLSLNGLCAASQDGTAAADPPTFTSSNHRLDLLVIARPETIGRVQLRAAPSLHTFAARFR